MNVRPLAVLITSLLIVIAACSGSEPTATPGPSDTRTATIRVTPIGDTIRLGTSLHLSATALNAAGAALSAKVIVWRSSDATRATVSTDGTVAAVGPGAVQITAESDGTTAVAALVVSPNAADALDVIESQGCAANVAGRVYCWGSNARGQLGSGCATTFCADPVAAPDTIPAIGVAMTWVSACALHADGSVSCWGNPALGTLGTGASTGTAAAVQLPPGVRFARITAGSFHVCGITVDGTAYCWGLNGGSQIGAATADQCILPGLIVAPTACSTTPLRVSGGRLFYRLGAGFQHTCGLATTGQTYCWGSRADGALGDSTIDASTTATPVLVSGAHAFTVLGVGSRNTCGSTPSTATYCWGASIGGQMADGLLPDADFRYDTPRATYAPSLRLIYGSRSNSILAPICGIDPSNTAWCWGENTDGQLGVSAGQTCATIEKTTCIAFPVSIPSFKALSIVPGLHHTCAISDDRRLYCWGRNDVGQLGNGSTTSSPSRVQVKGFSAPIG